LHLSLSFLPHARLHALALPPFPTRRSSDLDAISIDAAARVALITYPLMVLLFGALYGCTVSPGQALCGVVSLQTAHGRRVGRDRDRKSTRLNSSHVSISYAVFCLQKQKSLN